MTRLRRYTELPFLMEYLSTGRLAFLDPSKWEDGNDRRRLEEYRNLGGFNSIYACCLAECSETYHHWKIYSKGLNGVCVEFEKDELIDSLDQQNCIHKSVQYLNWEILEQTQFALDERPFVKRDVFKDEVEYRIIVTSPEEQRPVLFQNVPLTALRKIIINPWMPESTAHEVFRILELLPVGKDLSLWRSQLLGPT